MSSSLRRARLTTIGAIALGLLVAGCPTGDDPGTDPGGEDGGPTADAARPDGQATDGATADSAPPPPPCSRLTVVCKDGEKCEGAPDCASKVCRSGICQTAAPADGTKNGDETDVDCGGSKAPACADGKGCAVAADCTSSVCKAGICQAPSPTDGVKNGDETGKDCGGAVAPKCPAGEGCLSTADCDKVKCDLVQKKCLPASHSDGIKNLDETGIDCGGPTAGVPRCAPGQGCGANADCDNVRCDVGATNLCEPASHTDGLKNAGETGVDCGGAAPNKCPTGQGCVVTGDCDSVLCDVGGTKLCLPPTHTDGIKNGGETGIDCGGTALPLKCAPGQGCANSGDCNNVLCNAGTLVCDPPTSVDGLKNGTETDVDCGGGAPTNAPGCAAGLTCGVDNDCGSKACNYASKCVESRSCKVQHGGDTCGPAGNESCCVSLPAGGVNIDKYNITAGRMRAFVNATGGNLRGYIAGNTPAWWTASWSNFLPTMLDNGQVSPDDAPAFTGVYQELGPYVHGAFGGANEGCYIAGSGARTYRLPDAVNTRMSDPQKYSQAVLDDRPLNCVTVYMLAAFCAWDGGQLPTRQQIDVAWGAGKYPWGATAPAGYDAAYGIDPNGGFGRESYGGFSSAPFVAAPFATTDLQWANYNYNYWGGATQLGTDYSIYLAPPGRFPNGNSATGHADLAGSVFNATDIVGTGVYWSRSGSWQGHNIPWTAKGSWLNAPATNKYWAMGGRCARP